MILFWFYFSGLSNGSIRIESLATGASQGSRLPLISRPIYILYYYTFFVKVLLPMFFFFFFFFKLKWSVLGACLRAVPQKYSKQATEWLVVLHVMNIRLFEDTDTDLVRGDGRC